MKIRLELGDYKFSTTHSSIGRHRWLVVNMGEKPFSVVREFDEYGRTDVEEFVDKYLIEKMEQMLRKILVDACGAIPPGTDIQPETELFK